MPVKTVELEKDEAAQPYISVATGTLKLAWIAKYPDGRRFACYVCYVEQP